MSCVLDWHVGPPPRGRLPRWPPSAPVLLTSAIWAARPRSISGGPEQRREQAGLDPPPALLAFPWHGHRACPALCQLPTPGQRTAYLRLAATGRWLYREEGPSMRIYYRGGNAEKGLVVVEIRPTVSPQPKQLPQHGPTCSHEPPPTSCGSGALLRSQSSSNNL
ncbi:hypothetical protein EYF80_057765 [Liparis tanakae]|uniref:Uncharacterized protein n=1 Tax=Liparis tanakae TaxID=230148 RepID=A0A4Z2ET99_9TELE|nr:hypothetical protein EYF80_057765 [Liparis tanakae]